MYTLTANIFALFSFIFLIKYMFDMKIKFTQKECFYLILIGVFRSISSFYLNRALELSLYYIIFILFLYFFYTVDTTNLEYKNPKKNTDYYKKSNCDVLIGFFILFVFGLISDAYLIFFKYRFDSKHLIIKNIPEYLINGFLTFLIMIFLSVIFKKIKSKTNINLYKFDNVKIFVFSFIFFSLNIAYFLYKLLIVLNDPELYLSFLFVYLAYGVFMGTIILSLMKNVQIEKDDKKKTQLYSKVIEDSVEEIRAYKHDQRNILATLKEFIDTNNTQKLKTYFYEQIYNDVPDINNKEFLELAKVINLPLKSLLISKLARAKNFNINVELMISGNVSDLVMKEIDFCRVLGILIDNSIEEAAKTKDKILSLGIVVDENSLYYILSNSLSHIPDCKKIYKKNHSSKGKNRGFGLYNVKKIISKYSNCNLKTFIDNGIFYQEFDCKKIDSSKNSWMNKIINNKNAIIIENKIS